MKPERDEAMMRRALELAREATTWGDVPVGAVVYREDTGKIVGEGANARERDNDPTAHAEVVAMRAACERIGSWRLHECAMAVTLEPCCMCAGAIVNARLGRLVYGATDPKAGAVASLYEIASDDRLNHRVETTSGVLADECGEILREFFRSRR